MSSVAVMTPFGQNLDVDRHDPYNPIRLVNSVTFPQGDVQEMHITEFERPHPDNGGDVTHTLHILFRNPPNAALDKALHRVPFTGEVYLEDEDPMARKITFDDGSKGFSASIHLNGSRKDKGIGAVLNTLENYGALTKGQVALAKKEFTVQQSRSCP